MQSSQASGIKVVGNIGEDRVMSTIGSVYCEI